MMKLRRNAVAGVIVILVLGVVPWVVQGSPPGSDPGASLATVGARDDLPSRMKTIVDWTTVMTDSFDDVSVSCPPGMVALSGGVAVSSVADMAQFSNSPLINGNRLKDTTDGTYGGPTGWFGGVYNGDMSNNRPMKVAPVCAPLSGVQTVVSTQNVNPGAFSTHSVSCPAGLIAVGGGVDVESHIWITVTASSPTVGGLNAWNLGDGTHAAPTGWYGAVSSTSSTLLTYKVAVVCQPLGGVSTVVASKTASGSGWGTQRVDCPTGSVAVGGGIDVEDVYRMYVSQSAPGFELPQAILMQRDAGEQPVPVGWVASVINTDASDRTLRAAAICAKWAMDVFVGDEAPAPDR
jgi:hypothetical protein